MQHVSKAILSDLESFVGNSVVVADSDEPQAKSRSLRRRPRISPLQIAMTRTAGWLLVTTGLLLLGLVLHSEYLSNRVPWRTKVGPGNVGGLTIRDARAALYELVNQFRRERIIILSSDGQYFLSNGDVPMFLDVEETLYRLFRETRSPWFEENQRIRLASLFSDRTYSVRTWFDAERLVQLVTNTIPNLRERLPIDATVRSSGRQFVVVPGRDGLGFSQEKVLSQYRVMLQDLRISDLVVDVHHKAADIDAEMADRARRLSERLVRRSLIMTFSYDGYNYDTWSLPLWEVRNWVEFKKIREWGNYYLYPVLNTEKLRNHLNQRIAKYLYVPKEDVVVSSDYGRPIVEGIAKDGYYLDVTSSVAAINDTLRFEVLDSSRNHTVQLKVAHLVGGVANPDNEFGLSDVLATGVTDFFGSPENRKFNIHHASKRFQNVFLHPGDKFSFIRLMGKVDSANGYLKELVIVNGDSSEPQYGGGICQVSSTLFRTVFFAGLKVVNRVNHSFEVKYYRPVGLDATVFDPAPDLKFENDTGHLLLVQNYVDLKRTKMFFKLIGKKDGRKVEYEGPIYEGHVGENGEHYKYSWIRHVEMTDGTIKKEKFGSIYRNKELVKHHQPENLLVQKDSVFVPVSLDTTELNPSLQVPEQP
jgi:vancomycin resistance protein YoaR